MKTISIRAAFSCFALTLLLAATPQAVAADDVQPTKVLAHTKLIAPKPPSLGGKIEATPSFRTDPALGGIWVAYYYVGALVDESKDGATSFDVGPTNVPKQIDGTFVAFEASTMARPVTRPELAIEYAGVTLRLTKEDLERLLGAEAYREYLKSLEHPSNLRHLVEVRRYPLRESVESEVLASVLRLENMRPLSLEILVGQGALPKELADFMAKTNGSWLVRHRGKLLIVVTLIVMCGVVLWRLRR